MDNTSLIEIEISLETYFTLNEEARKRNKTLDQFINDILLDYVRKEEKILIKELINSIEELNKVHPQNSEEKLNAWNKVFSKIDSVNEFILKD